MAKSAQSTYLQYLPAIFQRRPEPDPEKSGSEQERVPFLGQFLRPFEDAIGSFEAVLAVVDRSFSPAFAQAGDFLPWLASWIALVLDEEWAEDRRRRLLAEAMQLYQWRGTIAGLKRYLEIYTELEPEAIEIRECRLPAGMQIGVASRIGGVVRQKTPGASSAPLGEIRTESRDYYFVDTCAPAAASPDSDPSRPAAIAQGDRVRFVYPAGWVQRVAVEEDGVRLWYVDPSSGDGSVPLHEVFHAHPDRTTPPAKRTPNITRRNGLVDYVATQSAPGSDKSKTLRGGSLLIEEMEAPYSFIVILHGLGPLFRCDPDSVDKLDVGLLPARLLDQFAQAKVPLTARASVEVQVAKLKWMIVDARKKYLIRLEDIQLEDGMLAIYLQSAESDEFDKVIKRAYAILDTEKPAHTQYYLRITPIARESRRRFMQVGVRSSIGADTLIS